MSTDYVRCPKCGNRNDIEELYAGLQAGEPETTVINCEVCGYGINAILSVDIIYNCEVCE